MLCQVITVELDDTFSIRCEYSSRCVQKFRSISGTWNTVMWVWRNGSINNAKKMCAELFGISDDLVTVEIFAKNCEKIDNMLMFGGYVIASRRYRDSKVTLGEGIELVSGGFSGSGGSAKSPRVDAADDLLFSACMRRDFAESHGLLDVAASGIRELAIKRIKELMAEKNELMAAHSITATELE